MSLLSLLSVIEFSSQLNSFEVFCLAETKLDYIFQSVSSVDIRINIYKVKEELCSFMPTNYYYQEF